MNTLAPLFRHSVGFDRFDDWLETALRSDQSNGYPPYDIIRESDGTYRVVMAVAGSMVQRSISTWPVPGRAMRVSVSATESVRNPKALSREMSCGNISIVEFPR